MSETTGEIVYKEYTRPEETDLSWDLYEQILDHCPAISHGYQYNYLGAVAAKSRIEAHLLRRLTDYDDLPPEVSKWQQSVKHWVPRSLMSWWQSQLRESGLDAINPYYLMTRASGMVAAYNDDKPIGAAAMFQVRLNDRPYGNGSADAITGDRPWFNEIRGLVVQKDWRDNKEHKVGRHLVRNMVEMGWQSKDPENDAVATVAITTNPAAARVFESAGGVTEPEFGRIKLNRLVAGNIMCWKPVDACNEDYFNGCAACPARNDTMWFWPALADQNALGAAGKV